MRAALIGGMPARLVLCLAAGVLDASVLALAGALAGTGLFGVAVDRARPSRRPAAELDHARDRVRHE